MNWRGYLIAWLLWSAFVLGFAFLLGQSAGRDEAITPRAQLRACMERERQVESPMPNVSLPPFVGPVDVAANPPVFDCFTARNGDDRCCFLSLIDAQWGFVSRQPLGCVPAQRGSHVRN